MNAWHFVCPTCKAPRMESCRTRYGRLCPSHMPRVRAAVIERERAANEMGWRISPGTPV